MQLEIEIECTKRCTGKPWSREFGAALGGRGRVNSEMHSEAVTERVWRCTCRLWSSEIGGVLGGGQSGGGRWEVRQVLRLHSSVSRLETVGMWWGDFTVQALMENWLVAVDRWGGTPEAEASLRGQLEIVRMKGRQTTLGVCCTRCMLYSVYAVLGVCCTEY